VVQYYDSFIDQGKLNIVMEYCDRTCLQKCELNGQVRFH
jgi:serine/threonine protein kinase